MKLSYAEEVPPEEPDYECAECGHEIYSYYTCSKCSKLLELDEFYCDGGVHYCQECGIVEAEEKAKNLPLPGQLDMFK